MLHLICICSCKRLTNRYCQCVDRMCFWAWLRHPKLHGRCCHVVRRCVCLCICMIRWRDRCTVCLCLHVLTCTGQGCVGVCQYDEVWHIVVGDVALTVFQPCPRVYCNCLLWSEIVSTLQCELYQPCAHMYSTCRSVLHMRQPAGIVLLRRKNVRLTKLE